MSRIAGQCPECSRVVFQEFCSYGWTYGSCMSGHAWKVKGEHWEPALEMPEPEVVRARLRWEEHEPRIPDQPDAFKWCYGG